MNRFCGVILLGWMTFLAPGCQDNPDVVVPLVDPALGGGTGVGAAVIDSIVVTPATATIAINESQLYQATALDAAGDPISNVAFFWNTSDTTIATIDANGLASAIVPGTVEISATSGGILNDPPAELIVDCGGLPDSINNAVIVPPTVSTFGTASITVDVTDCNGDPVPDGTQVSFQLTPGSLGSVTSPGATVQQGTPALAQATSTFTALNQGGNGTITISSGDATPASVNVTVAPPGAGSIEFVSAQPTIIGVKGASQPETSVITFSVRDENGNPVADGTQIDFEMIGPNCISQLPEPFDDANNNDVFDAGENFDDRDLSGDYSMNLNSDCPNPADDLNDEFITPIQGATLGGFVSVTLHSGKVAGPVKIIATVHGQILSTGTTGVSIGGGVPSASGFHISATVINIAGNVMFEGYDDQTTDLTAFIKDRFGNSNVLTGTSISFMTEAGTLVSSDVTADTSGTVVTTLTSQGTIPVNVHQWIDIEVTSGSSQNTISWTDPVQIAWDAYPHPVLGTGTPVVYDLYWSTSLDRLPNTLLGIPFDNDGTGWNQLPGIGVSPFTHTGLTNGTAYFYVLVASDGNGRVAQSPLISATPRSVGVITDVAGIAEPSYPSEFYPRIPGDSITTAIRNPRDGWTTITGIVQGEETFFDANGNGFYDVGETFIDTPGEPFVDADDNGVYTTPETFEDDNQNGIYDFGEDFDDENNNGLYDEGDPVYLDANDNGVWDGPNGQWDSNTFIWNTIRIVFSGGPAFDSSDDVVDLNDAPFNSPPQTASRIEIDFGHQDLRFGGTFSDSFLIPNGDCAILTLYVSDPNLNRLTAGSVITVNADEYDIVGQNELKIPDGLSTGPSSWSFGLCDDDPNGIETRSDFVDVTITWTVPGKDALEVVMTVSGTVDFIGPTVSVLVFPPSIPFFAVGDSLPLVAVAIDSFGNPVAGETFFWISDTPAVATVDPAGIVTAVAPGMATITASTGAIPPIVSAGVPVTVIP